MATLTRGGRGEFTVWVDGAQVAGKVGVVWPDEADTAERVAAALG
jgi:hypothetical protein